MQDVEIPALFSGFRDVNVLCIGDVFLDEYIHGAVERISPEAPVPILKVTKEYSQLGGAGNTANNIAALGARCTLISAIGTDAIGRDILRLVATQWPRITPELLNISGHDSITKVRFVSGSQQMLRVDRENVKPLSTEKEREICTMINQHVPHHDVIVISDYDKGVLTPTVIRYTIEIAKDWGKPVIVDPKLRPCDLYRGAHVITPNRKEFDYLAPEGSSAFNRAYKLMHAYEINHVLLTKSEEGMQLMSLGCDLKYKSLAHQIVDVSGAGDTVVAVMALAIGKGLEMHMAASIANVAAGLVVAKQGTAYLALIELEEAYEKYKRTAH